MIRGNARTENEPAAGATRRQALRAGGGSGFVTPAALSTIAFQNGVRAGHGQTTISYRFD